MSSTTARSAAVIALVASLGLLVPGTAPAALGPTEETPFDEALRFFYAKKYEKSAALLHRYIIGAGEAGEKIENARYFLARSLAELGLHYAATEFYYEIAKERRAPEFIRPSLVALEEISRERPYDFALIVEDLVYDTPLGSAVTGEVSNWVWYWRGVMNYKKGLERWAEEAFDEVEKDTYWYYKAQYARAIWNLRLGGPPDDSIPFLVEVINAEAADPEVKNLARHGYARLLFERGDFDEAFWAYDAIRGDVRTEAQILLEKAWAKFYLKDYRKAMGLLLSLDAPVYEGFFAPEKYVLRALILKNYCHYRAAKTATTAFRDFYRESMKAIRNRSNLAKVPVVYDAAVQEGELKRADAFLETLKIERDSLKDFPEFKTAGLTSFLDHMYELKTREFERRISLTLREATERVAEALLDYEEQMNILDYEIGLDLYRRIRSRVGADDALFGDLKIPRISDKVYYRFEGEYWLDELHDMEFHISNRCVE